MLLASILFLLLAIRTRMPLSKGDNPGFHATLHSANTAENSYIAIILFYLFAPKILYVVE